MLLHSVPSSMCVAGAFATRLARRSSQLSRRQSARRCAPRCRSCCCSAQRRGLVLHEEHSDCTSQAENRATGAQARVRSPPGGQHVAGHSRDEVDPKHLRRAKERFRRLAEVVEGEAVHQNVRESAVEEHRGAKAVVLSFEEHACAILEAPKGDRRIHLLQDEHNRVDAQQDVGQGRPLRLPSEVTLPLLVGVLVVGSPAVVRPPIPPVCHGKRSPAPTTARPLRLLPILGLLAHAKEPPSRSLPRTQAIQRGRWAPQAERQQMARAMDAAWENGKARPNEAVRKGQAAHERVLRETGCTTAAHQSPCDRSSNVGGKSLARHRRNSAAAGVLLLFERHFGRVTMFAILEPPTGIL
eukprot:scaffold1944_cov241-Pinguiococcus_pyrenoidosus.AAC.2